AMTGRVGVFSVGLAAYWPQLPGLWARLESYRDEVEGHLARFGVEIVSAGTVDGAPKAKEAGVLFGGVKFFV
ncbi:MAG: hypothetical protein WB542_03035, partial [Polaromonas sp.]